MEKVILASRNKGKLKEIQAILEKFGMETISRDDAGIPEFEVEETGTTFEENSLLKAQAILDEAHTITIADDSGLEVDALEGAPGVYSARFAGENCTFEDNNRKLLKELEGVPEEKRGAAFVSVITMLFPDGRKLVARGECRGTILTELGYYLEVTNSYKDKVPEEWIRKQTLTNAERYITPELKKLEDMIREKCSC